MERFTFNFLNLQCLVRLSSSLLNVSLHFEEVNLSSAQAHIRWTVSQGTVGVAPLIHSSIPFPGSCSLARSRRGCCGRGLGVRWGSGSALCWYSSWIRSCSSIQCLFDCIYQRVPNTTQQLATIHFTRHINMYCQVYIILRRKKDGSCKFYHNTLQTGAVASWLVRSSPD